MFLPRIFAVPTNLVIPALGDLHSDHNSQLEFSKCLHDSMHSVHNDHSEIIQRVVPVIPYDTTSVLVKLYMISDNKNHRKGI